MDPETAALAMSKLLAETSARKRALRREAEELESAGRPAEGGRKYEELVRLDPRDPDSWQAWGLLCLRAGRQEEALERLLEARRIEPRDAARHYDLGRLLPPTGEGAAALAGALPSLGAESWRELLASVGRPDFSRLVERELVERGPEAGDRRLELGNLLMMLHQLDGAVRAFRAAVELAPDDAQAWKNLGTALERQGRTGEARRHLGRARLLQGRYREAAECFEHSLGLETGDAETYAALAECYGSLLRFDDAVRTCREGLHHHPGSPELHRRLSQALMDAGRTSEGFAAAAAAGSRFPGDLSLTVLEKLLFPRLCDSDEEAARAVGRYARGLAELEREMPLDAPGAARAALAALRSAPRAYAQYQDVNLRELRRLHGELVHRVVRANYPRWAEPLPRRPGDQGRRIRVGYASSYLGSAAGSRWLLGWLEHHRREEFQIYGYHFGRTSDPLTWEFRRRCDVFRRLPEDLEAACARIAADELDVLVWTDFASVAQTILMGGLRLAPVQCAGWGYPYTSGLPTMDYCLSAELAEPEDAAEHYTEQLIRLPGIGVTYFRPVVPERSKARAAFGFREGAVVYLSLQTVSKYLPRFDGVYPAIAQRVSRAQFVWLAPAEEALRETFQERLRRSFAAAGLAAEDHCLFVPELRDRDDYLMRNRAADVFLDTFVWSGCVTTLEAVACGLPVVTCPGRFRRGRQSYAILRQLGVTETVAQDEAEYVAIAARLGLDEAWRREIGRRLVEGHPRLYEDTAPLRAVEDFYRRVARG